MYLERTLEPILLKAVREFPIIALMGPRQVGKTTLLRKLFSSNYTYLTFDDIALRDMAKRDPALFIKNHPGKVILDEIQYVPELLPELKMASDREGKPGRFLMTGSQQFTMMRNMKETLAGRVLLLTLPGMTLRERMGEGGRDHWVVSLLRDHEIDRSTLVRPPDRITPVGALIRGGLPGLMEKSDLFINPFFSGYVKTYLERDIPSQFDIKDVTGLSRLLALLAPLSSREFNKSQFGRELGISPPTAHRWLTWLESSLVWKEHPPYHGNLIKRVSKHSKGFLFDTGLICHLMRVTGADDLAAHPAIGGIFETAMRLEISAAVDNALLPVRCYHWRTPYGHEVDIVLESGRKLYALECKWGSDVDDADLRGIEYFRKAYGKAVAFSAILTPYGHYQEIANGVFQVPWFRQD